VKRILRSRSEFCFLSSVYFDRGQTQPVAQTVTGDCPASR